MNGIAAYRENSLTTQSRGRLIVMLYDGAVKFLRKALESMDAEDDGEKGRMIVKAMAILDELDACLNIEAGGEIARNLRALYGFMHRQLFRANVDRSPEKVEEVIRILKELNEGWRAIAT